MHPRERFLAALRGDALDRPPVWLMRQAGRYLPGYRALRAEHSFWDVCQKPELSTRAALEPLDRYALDAAIVFSDILVIPLAMGLGVTFGKGEGPIIAKPLRTGADYDAWFARRLYTENLLTGHNLLAGQKFINKTYPTNSGEEPTGLEALARERYGRNAMNADGAANLMLALVSGEFGFPAAEYIRTRLRRPPVSEHSSMGGGFPEGTAYESKIGDAYDTLAEIVHAELPDGRRLIIAAFSNGRDPDGPDEQDLTALAGFSKLLLEKLPASDD